MRVINDKINSQNIVIFHNEGANSALDADSIGKSKDIGATGVFVPEADGRKLTFDFINGAFVDKETNSKWNIFGQATEGKLKGKNLKRLQHGDFFAFSWLTFRPETTVFESKVQSPKLR
jgi:hypothetical protein